jgi:PRTRC genetic system ThiF family protein
MRSLTIDPPIPYLLPADRPISILLVGCGGTGSHLAQALARLASHVRDGGGPALTLIFVDGDVVEPKNVGRQLFSRADVGKNKAQVLASRFGAVFGLPIAALPAMLDEDFFRTHAAPVLGERYNGPLRVSIGAVDTAAARATLHKALAWGNLHLWLDCGNHEHSGQVCLGSAAEADELRGALALGSLCGALPSPGLQFPDLLKPPPKRKKRVDCADAMVDNAQSLQVNQMMAAIAGQYLYQLVVARRLTTFQTVVDIQSLTMRSLPITAANLAEATGMAVDHFTAAKKGRAA